MTYFPTLSRQDWPHDPQDLDAYYGDPRGDGAANPAWVRANLVSFTFPWKMKGANTFQIHQKVRASLDRVLSAIWDYLGHDQTKIEFYHLDETGGTFAYRANRNNASVLSNHSRGIAIDLAPDENPNRAAWVDQAPPHLPRFVIEAFKQEGWRWGGDYNTTKDAMHFEAVFDQHHDQQPVPAPQPSAGPVVSPTSVKPPAAPPITPPPIGDDPIGDLIRQWLLTKSGLPAEISRVQATTLAQLLACRQQIDAAIAGLQAFTLDHAAAPTTAPISPVTPVAPVAQPKKFTGIYATCFGGSRDPNTSAYDGHLIDDIELGVSFPWRLKSAAFVVVELNGVQKTAKTVDVGPWNTKDNYAAGSGRPLAEQQHANKTKAQNGRVPTNPAGIDLTPGLVIALGGAPDAAHAATWSGTVNWWFVTEPPATGGTIMNAVTSSPITSGFGATAIAAAMTDLVTNWGTKNWAGVVGNAATIIIGIGLLFAGDGTK